MYYILRILILISFSCSILLSSALADDREHPGYISDVKNEKYLKVVEFVVPPEEQEITTDLQSLIFTEEFSKDMLSRYHRQFGYTDSQIIFQAPNRFEEFTSFDGTRVTLEEDVRRKRKFAEFMLRKLTEYHVDNYLQGNSNTKTLYKIKTQVSNASIGIGGGFKLRAKYSFSGQELKLRFKNPYGITNELIMDFESDLDFANVDYIYHIGFPIFWKLKFDNYFNTGNDDLTTVLSRRLKNRMLLSITNVSSFDRDSNENRIIFGLNWRF